MAWWLGPWSHFFLFLYLLRYRNLSYVHRRTLPNGVYDHTRSVRPLHHPALCVWWGGIGLALPNLSACLYTSICVSFSKQICAAAPEKQRFWINKCNLSSLSYLLYYLMVFRTSYRPTHGVNPERHSPL